MKKKSRKPSPTSPATGNRILHAFLEQVPFDGWTEASYAAALKESGITRTAADKLCPQGLADLAEQFGTDIDAATQKHITAHRGFARLRVRDKIAFAVRARIEALAPHKEAVRRLMIWYAFPHRLPLAIKRIYKTVDLIWVAAGDTSTDYNFYTKRILLAGVFKTTLIFWLGDESPDNKATWEFLDRRIADVMKLGKGISLLKEFKPAEIVDLMRDKLRKVI